jgi:uncharacterized protein (TIGR02246 family)
MLKSTVVLVALATSVIGARAQSIPEMQKLADEWAAAFNRGDIATVVSQYKDDAVVFPPGGDMVKGKQAITALWTEAQKGLQADHFKVTDVRPLGPNAAREQGYAVFKTKGDNPQEMTGKYVVVWEKVGGQWKLDSDIWNLNAPTPTAAAMNMHGTKVYEYDLDLTGTTDYGIAMDDIMSGKVKVPPQGARFDVSFVGPVKGKVNGQIKGIDYLQMRADGRLDLDFKASIETTDGQRIGVTGGGVASPRQGEPIADLAENVRLITASPAYSWVNNKQVWGIGEVNTATKKVHIEGYMQ